ncbi:MAG TPA: hypothetical protein VF039_07885, partial [Longimicrobiales bacterium]
HVADAPTTDLAVRVHVERKLPLDVIDDAHRIPSEIDGVRTDVIEGSFELHHSVTPTPDAARYDPLQGGISIGPCALPPHGGTLGCCARDAATGKSLILSSFHTLTAGRPWQPGQQVAQPARIDGGSCPADVAGSLLRAVLDAEVDGAVAELAGRPLANTIVDVGGLTGVAAASLGLRVRKRGRTTRLTWGVVDGIDMTVRVATGAGPIELKRQIRIRVDPIASRHFGMPGDSGAVVVDGFGRAIGLYVAGSTDGSIGIANDFQRVLDALGVELCKPKKTTLKEKPELKDMKDKPEPGEKPFKDKPEPGEKPMKDKPEPGEKPVKDKPEPGEKSHLFDKADKDEGKAHKSEGEGKPPKPEPNETKQWDPKELTDWEIWRWKQETGKEPGPENETKVGDHGWPPEEEGGPEHLLTELEGEVERLRHFIHERLRPNLTRGALKWEDDLDASGDPVDDESADDEEDDT